MTYKQRFVDPPHLHEKDNRRVTYRLQRPPHSLS